MPAYTTFCGEVIPKAQRAGANHFMFHPSAISPGDRAMASAWTVQDNAGQILAGFDCASRLEVARKVAPTHYDPFRLRVSHSYREIFDRAVNQVLQTKGWKIVRLKPRKADLAGTPATA
jgi:hypothetical protein